MLFLILSISVYCQDVDKNALSAKDSVLCPAWYEMFTNIPGNWVDFSKSNFITAKIPLYTDVALLTAGLIASDENTWKSSDKVYKSHGSVKSMSDFFVKLGDGKSQFGLAAAYAAYGFISSDKKALRTASQITQAVLASGAVVQVLKHITGRQSPFVSTEPRGRWDFFPNQIDYHKHVPAYDAFPSGHLTTTIATVIVIAENYPDVHWIKPVGYTLSGFLAISMVNTGIHWYSDYPLALVLGYAFGMIAAHPEGISEFPGNKKLQIAPSITNNGLGVGIYYSLN